MNRNEYGMVVKGNQMSINEIDKIFKEYQLLFDVVLCNILFIDCNYCIVKINVGIWCMVGDIVGGYCYEGLKGFDYKCVECMV